MTSGQPAHRPGAHLSCVIGAGVAGLAAIKSCLEEGIEPVCFEQHDDIGGIWRYTEHCRHNQGAGAFHNLITNTCRETTPFSDFPFPDDSSKYLPHREVLKYLRAYTKHFKLLNFIQFHTQVIRVWPTEDFDQTGRWNVLFKRLDRTDEDVCEIYDSIFVCSGMNKEAAFPDMPGRESFHGDVIHMMQYRHPRIFDGRRVLVIGNSHSAGDVACDAGTCASEVYLSTGRDGLVIFSRLTDDGEASELRVLSRFIRHLVSQKRFGDIASVLSRRYMNYDELGLKHGGNAFTTGVVMVSDDLRYKLTTGIVKVVPPVVSFTETGVNLEGGRILEVDTVVMATGYLNNFDFIDIPCIKGKSCRPSSDNHISLYKGVFPLTLKPATLVMADAVNSIGGPEVAPIELRCRWGARLVMGRCQLPPLATMETWVKQERDFLRTKCAGRSKQMWDEQCDYIADEIGVRPHFVSLFLRSPSMAYKVFFGPILPFHYRLQGPGASAVAWQQCHAIYDRLYATTLTTRLTQLVKLSVPLVAIAMYYRMYVNK